MSAYKIAKKNDKREITAHAIKAKGRMMLPNRQTLIDEI